MVQVIGPGRQKPTFGQKLGAGFQQALSQYGEHAEKEKSKQLMAQEDRAAEQMGIKLKGISDPKIRQEIVKGEYGVREKLQGQQQSPQDLKRQEDSYNIIKSQFGDEAADLFKSLPTGGQTELVKNLFEGRQRGQDLFSKVDQQKTSFKTVDYDKGLTPKERAQRQNSRYDKNLPLYEAGEQKLHALEHEADSLATLRELSPEIQGWQRLNINPSTGSLIIPALASPEAQRFSKIVNDFTVNAKDSFGARVSNFELDRFMQRLPTLANSVEGREAIIRQMQIVNEMNLKRNKELQNVFEEHGGLRNIDYDQAQRIAEKNITPKMTELKSEYRKVERNVDKQYDKVIDKKKKDLVPPGRVMIEKDGKQFSVPKGQLKKAIDKGYKAI